MDEGEKFPASFRLESLDIPAGAKMERLGMPGKLKWTTAADGLTVRLPAKPLDSNASELAWTVTVTC